MKTIVRVILSRARTWLWRSALVVTAIVVIATTGCGTTSGLKGTGAASLENISRFNTVSVLDFADRTPKKVSEDKLPPGLAERMREQGRHFADLIAAELTRTGVFEKVSRLETASPGTLVVTGEITRLTEGSSALRFWIGFGAGSSYFDATVRILDADSQRELGQIKVDKNSWPLGGVWASTQTVEQFMGGAAKRVADELARAKVGRSAAK